MKAIYGFIAAGLVGTTAWTQEAKIAEGESAGVPAKVEKGQGQSDGELRAGEKLDEQSLVGKSVYDEKGRELGRVKELVMDKAKGEMGYAVIEVKDSEGLKLPVPARALKQNEGDQKLVLNVSENVLTALEIYRDEELPAADAFSVDGAVGSAASKEKGSSSSEVEEKTDGVQEEKAAEESE